MSTGEIRTEAQARAILQLSADAPSAAWRPAFQKAVKAAHPDHGGDSERVRLVIAAYHLLKTLEPPPRVFGAGPRPGPTPRAPAAQRTPPPPAAETGQPAAASDLEPDPRPNQPPLYRISITEAFIGAEKTVRLAQGSAFKVRLPAGLQSGDVVRFGPGDERQMAILVSPLPGAELIGSDLWLNVGVSEDFMKTGGRVEVDTPLGPRRFWVSRTSAARGLFRAPNEGLPARGSRARGHLYLKLEPDPTLSDTRSKSLLRRFAAAWAA